MKKIGKIILLQLILAIFLLTGCINAPKEQETVQEEESVRTFADWTECEIFQDIPALIVRGSRISDAENYGADTYIMNVAGTSLQNYQEYLVLLEEEGYSKHVDNGAEGLDGCVYTATYTKDSRVLTVSHMVKTNVTYIAASENQNLSEHLFYKESYIANNQEGAKTVLHMPELHTYGDSYILQLKNGHFILIDGGMEQDAPYLFDYLETLVPEGQKPFIEAWIITHGHGDHIGPFTTLMKNNQYADRIIVEGIYFTEPSMAVCTKFGVLIQNVEYGAKACKNSEGKSPKIYRMQTGQRFYFNDITFEVLHTQEQLFLEDYENGFNDSSTWLLFHIDGQKFLTGGDASEGSIGVVKRTYNQEYFDLDILSVFHHGQNVYDSYVDWFTFKTALYPTFVVGSQTANYQTNENNKLQKNAVECLSWGDGTKVLTFPYELGTAKSLKMRVWTYHPGRETPKPY